MSFEPTDIKKVAHLARLNISEKDIHSYSENLSKILDLIEQIKHADTEDVSPMAHPLEDMIQPLREDVVTESNERDAFMAIAPKTEAGLYLVPKVMEDKES